MEAFETILMIEKVFGTPLRDGAAGKVPADRDLMEPPRPEARTREES